MIIDRGEAHRPFYGSVSERSSLPPLRGDHVGLMEILLRRGAVASIARFSDGATAQDLAAQRLSSDRTEVERTILRKLVSVLNSPPSVELLAPETELEDRPLVTITAEARSICDNFSVRLQYHKTGAFLPRQFPIGSFIYLPECPTAKKCIGDLERWAIIPSLGWKAKEGSFTTRDRALPNVHDRERRENRGFSAPVRRRLSREYVLGRTDGDHHLRPAAGQGAGVCCGGEFHFRLCHGSSFYAQGDGGCRLSHGGLRCRVGCLCRRAAKVCYMSWTRGAFCSRAAFYSCWRYIGWGCGVG